MRVRLCISVSKPTPSLAPPPHFPHARAHAIFLPSCSFLPLSISFCPEPLRCRPAAHPVCMLLHKHAYKHLHHDIGADTGPCAPKAAMVCKSAKSCLAATCVHLVLVGRNGHKSGWPGVRKDLRAQCSQVCSIRQSISQQLYANHIPSCRARHSPPHDEPAP